MADVTEVLLNPTDPPLLALSSRCFPVVSW
jgi:hypothetical protein